MEDKKPKIGKELAEFIEDLFEERNDPDYYEKLKQDRSPAPMKTFKDGSRLATRVSHDIGANNSIITWSKVARLPNKELSALFVERFRKNIFYVEAENDDRLTLRFPLDGGSSRYMPLDEYCDSVRDLNSEERRQLWIENDRERSMQKDKDTVLAIFPEAYLEKISDRNFFAVYSNNELLKRKRLSLDPFEGKTATTREQAWSEAAEKVNRLSRKRGIGY